MRPHGLPAGATPQLAAYGGENPIAQLRRRTGRRESFENRFEVVVHGSCLASSIRIFSSALR
jgi:hypothetical protein